MNTISTSKNISTLPNSPQSLSANKVHKSIDKVSNKNNEISINITDRPNRGNLAQGLSKINDGLMVTSLVHQGLNKQKTILNDIKNILSSDATNKNDLKQMIDKKLNEFQFLSQEVRFNDKKLLSGGDDIDLSSASQTITLQLPTTLDIASDLNNFVANKDLNENNIKAFKREIDKSNQKLDIFDEKFNSAKTQLSEHAKQILKEHTQETQEKQTQISKKYDTDMSNFSQPNINNIAGHFIASQANMAQASGSRLLY